jgi:hypothetical protein
VIRPEAKAQIWRFREVLAGGCGLAIGLWWLLGQSALLLIPGAVFSIAGLALIWIGIQRSRFRSEGQGPGAVHVDEGQITYFGPLTGGVVALRELDGITYDPSQHPAHWRLAMAGAPELMIPVNAAGSDGLFDAFATLPGFRMAQALAALKGGTKHPIVIWKRDLSGNAQRALH